ncbi:pantoate--beta-alanine ligase [Pradoshia sp. D12]|uniref:pantoate--beta-alanine ligase n=1 Tax=Bacillaceae TaxID=186817 RepID=UPI00111D722D|nr:MULTISPECIES: pantoate--beta-alanine ligase [Bacillaceae]QFK71783.1 pantoate--beta-alanine ligase [Pradoshia sp. D12]TPF73578.1 pantoate--beta-alanine ligase [Bacillus sp. D12]
MKIISQINELREVLDLEREKKHSIGFVPTMGYLHEGHLSLIQEAREKNHVVVISIFVNPLQFGPNEDFDKYPRDMERDEELARNAGVDYLFYPTVQEMYGDKQTLTVKVHERTDVLCGKSRPGHFDGVATVLTKLFTIVHPTRTYFGLKDAQQVAVVEGIIHDFNFPIELVGVEIKREEDGLALSSRNINLTEQEREEAPFIYKSLCKVKAQLQKGASPAEALEKGKEYLQSHINGQIDYFEGLSYPDLSEITEHDQRIIFAVAVQYTSVRLIDNIIINL